MDGQVLDRRYRLEAEIARGAIGVVWRAVDVTSGESVAVKMLRPEAAEASDLVTGFLAEAEILAGLDHPSVVRVRNLITDDGLMALVMDLVPGADLRRRLRTGGPIAAGRAATIAAQVADALDYIHALGVTHGDIKPGNLLLPDDGGPVRLADFGVARRAGEPAGPTLATPEYVAPEVVAGDPPSPAADIYALGIVIYEMLCARSPYRGGPPSEVLRRHAGCVPVPPAGMPTALWDIAEACIQLDPRLRPAPATVAARLRAARAALAEHPPLVPLPAGAVTHWPRSAEVTAPMTAALPRVSWVPLAAAPVSPAATDAARFVAVPVEASAEAEAAGGVASALANADAVTRPNGVVNADAVTRPNGVVNADAVTAPNGVPVADAVTAPNGVPVADAVTAPNGVPVADLETAPNGVGNGVANGGPGTVNRPGPDQTPVIPMPRVPAESVPAAATPVGPASPAPVWAASAGAAPVSPAPVSPAPVSGGPVSPAVPVPVSSGPVSPAPPASGGPVSGGPVSPAPPVSPAVPLFVTLPPPGAPDIIPPDPYAAPAEPKPVARRRTLKRSHVLTGVAAAILVLLFVGAGVFLSTNVFNGDSRPTGSVVDGGPGPAPSGTPSQQPPTDPPTQAPSASPSTDGGDDSDGGGNGNDGGGDQNDGGGNGSGNGNDGNPGDGGGSGPTIPGFPGGIGDPLPPMPTPPRR